MSIAKFSKKLVFLFVCILTMISSYYFIQKYVYYGEDRFVYPDLPVITKLNELAGYDRVLDRSAFGNESGFFNSWCDPGFCGRDMATD